MSCSKNDRPAAGRSNTRVSEISNWPLQHLGVLTITEAVVQRGVADAEPIALPLRPGVPVEPDPHRPGGIGVGLPKRPAPVGGPQVEVEVVDKAHLPSPTPCADAPHALGPWPSTTATSGVFSCA